MLRRVVNDYSACSFIVAIRALSSIGKFFIDAIKRVLDETRGQAGATRHAQSVRAILSMILDMTLKGDGDEWRRRIEQPVYMSKLRAHFAHVNGADPRLSAAVSVPVHMATDAIISLLRENDQRHFKVVTKKAYRCPHCNTVRTTKYLTCSTGTRRDKVTLLLFHLSAFARRASRRNSRAKV